MTGCVKPYVKPQLPPNLKHCEQIPVFNGENFGDVVTSYFELIHLYKDCNAKSEAKNSYFKNPQ